MFIVVIACTEFYLKVFVRQMELQNVQMEEIVEWMQTVMQYVNVQKIG